MDEYHHDDYTWLTNGLVDAWGRWLTPDAITTLQAGAYYTMLAQPGLRIISVNAQFGDYLNFYLFLEENQQETELQWFADTLAAAEENGEKVIIIGHIPPVEAAPSILVDWASVYVSLVNRFSDIIVGQFFGHTHEDEVRIAQTV